MNNQETNIQSFLRSQAFGVVGASVDRGKYGNKVLRCYLQHQKTVHPVNPREKTIEGIPCVKSILDLPPSVQSISVITPPPITEHIVKQAKNSAITHIWLQPGAESEASVQYCKEDNIRVIYGGPCILVVLGFRDI